MASSKNLLDLLEDTLAIPTKTKELEDSLPDAPLDKGETEIYNSINKKRKKKRRVKENKTEFDEDDVWINPLFEKKDVSLSEVFSNKSVIEQRPLSTAELVQLLEEKEDDSDVISDVRLREKETYINGTSENAFTKEFAPELAQLYDTIDNVQNLQDTLKKSFVRETTKGRGGFNKNINELIMNILDCDKTKLQVIKEINSVKKNIINLTTSSEKNKTTSTEDTEFNANNFLKSIMSGVGRNNFITQLNSASPDIATGTAEPTFDVNNYDTEKMDEISDIVLSQLEDRTPIFSSEHDLYIKYELENPKILIRLIPGTEDWEFVAIGDNGHIPDYPLPNPIDVGALEFNDDKTIATARSGESYEVINSYCDANVLEYENEFN